jgi:hypothetical protein
VGSVILFVALLVAIVYGWPWWAIALLVVCLVGAVLGELDGG